ncbi:MAG: hypothetical protein AVDCRST_MAG85-3416 [uncultured Solirubrobacteraceae bacterium]|uniref:Uncharacterized protein n=1 Tax=uncultured Solirubrobacteraceae bacterium TaxID=1162706 RepID=A0A6J4TPU1_9ACTN|nr:MAG: hypothetical protein AVDCRST_MAG85-3416 [uncultured Solirubrobacteraceae bacterium]
MNEVSAALTRSSPPLNDADDVPFPLTPVRPVSEASVTVPFVAVSVTDTLSAPASTSSTLKVSDFAVSSSVVAVAGTVFAGPSLTAATVTPIDSLSDFAPPEPE